MAPQFALVCAACAHPVNAEDPIQGSGGGESSTRSNSSSLTTANAVTTGSGGVSGPATSDVGGSAGAVATTAGAGGSGAGSSLGGAAGAPSTSEGSGGAVPEDECAAAADCEQPQGECVVCELGTTAARECVNLDPSVCDGEKRDASELCDGTDLGDLPTSCVEFGTPGEFSGGTVVCNDTCDDYDPRRAANCAASRRLTVCAAVTPMARALSAPVNSARRVRRAPWPAAMAIAVPIFPATCPPSAGQAATTLGCAKRPVNLSPSVNWIVLLASGPIGSWCAQRRPPAR